MLAGLRKAPVFTNSVLEEKEVLRFVVYVVGWWSEQNSRQNPRNTAFKTSKITIIHAISLPGLLLFQQAAFKGAPLASANDRHVTMTDPNQNCHVLTKAELSCFKGTH